MDMRIRALPSFCGGVRQGSFSPHPICPKAGRNARSHCTAMSSGNNSVLDFYAVSAKTQVWDYAVAAAIFQGRVLYGIPPHIFLEIVSGLI